MQDIITNCRRFISNGKLEKAIDLLMENGLGSEKELYHISGWIQYLKNAKNSGTAQDDFLVREENKIRQALLSHIESIELASSKSFKVFPPVPMRGKNLQRLVYILSIALVVIVSIGGYHFFWNNQGGNLNNQEKTKGEESPSDTTEIVIDEPEQFEDEPNVKNDPPGRSIPKKETGTKVSTKINPPAVSRESLVAAATESYKKEKGFNAKLVKDHIKLGEHLMEKGFRKEGIIAIGESIRQVKYYANGYKVLSEYLINENDYSLANAYLPDFNHGVSIMKDDPDYKLDYETVLAARKNLVDHFHLKLPLND